MSAISGDRMALILGALANPQRIRIVAVLYADGRDYVSRLARKMGISRPLLHLHLQRLEEAGLVRSQLELSSEGKALNYFEVTEFGFELSPSTVAEAAKSLSLQSANEPSHGDQHDRPR